MTADVHSTGMRRGQNSTPKLLTQWPSHWIRMVFSFQNKLLLWRTPVCKQDSTHQRNIQARREDCGTQLPLMPSTRALPGYKACSSWIEYCQASPQGFPTCTCLGNSNPSRIRDHWVRSAAWTFSGLPSFSSQTLEVLDDGQSRTILTNLPWSSLWYLKWLKTPALSMRKPGSQTNGQPLLYYEQQERGTSLWIKPWEVAAWVCRRGWRWGIRSSSSNNLSLLCFLMKHPTRALQADSSHGARDWAASL